MANEIRIRADGTLVFMQDDALDPVMRALGAARVERASHVEPATADGSLWGVWYADGRPTGKVFATRALALAWEREHFFELIGG